MKHADTAAKRQTSAPSINNDATCGEKQHIFNSPKGCKTIILPNCKTKGNLIY